MQNVTPKLFDVYTRALAVSATSHLLPTDSSDAASTIPATAGCRYSGEEAGEKVSEKPMKKPARKPVRNPTRKQIKNLSKKPAKKRHLITQELSR